MNLIFLGPPGSGKGTQAAKLSDKLGLIHLSTGDLLREAVKDRTELGKQAQEFMQKGELVPDALIVGLIQDKINSGKLSKGFILDGFPRTIPQAESLKSMLVESGVTWDKAICFNVDDNAIVTRMAGRRLCPTCQATYNVNVAGAMPKVEGKCDNDGAALTIRDDDKEEVVTHRLSVYHTQTKPIVDFYKQESLLVEIDADTNPDDVFNSLLDEIQVAK